MKPIFHPALVSCLALPLLLSGCSWMPFSIPFLGGDDEKPEAAPTLQAPASGRVSISPEVREYMLEAEKYWTDSGECVDPEQAAALLDKAVELDPLDPAPYLMRSRALSDMGYHNDAFSDATKAIRLSPTAEAYAVRGLICLKQNQPRGAARDFEYAEKLDPREPKIYEYRAAGAFLEGRVKDACNDLEQACRLGSCRPWENATKNKVCR